MRKSRSDPNPQMWQMTPVTGDATAGADVLRWPLVGRLLKLDTRARSCRSPCSIAAAVLVLHGLVGPQVAPGNLATVLTWVHYRGLLVVALLAAGNLFCAGCPFVLVRDLGRRLHPPARLWPQELRGKWLAIVLFVGVLFSSTSSSTCGHCRARRRSGPRLLRRRAGDRPGLQGRELLQAPLPDRSVQFRGLDDVAARAARFENRSTCESCRTSDCIAGRRAPEAPAGSCSAAASWASTCPPRSATSTARSAWTACTPVRTTTSRLGSHARPRAGRCAASIRYRPAGQPPGHRCARGAVRVWGAAERIRDGIARLSASKRGWPQTLGSTIGSAGARMSVRQSGSAWRHCVLLGSCCQPDASTLAATRPVSTGRIALRYAYGLVPFGFGMWLAHYGFHFLTGALTVVPVTQSAAIDLMG